MHPHCAIGDALCSSEVTTSLTMLNGSIYGATDERRSTAVAQCRFGHAHERVAKLRQRWRLETENLEKIRARICLVIGKRVEVQNELERVVHGVVNIALQELLSRKRTIFTKLSRVEHRVLEEEDALA